jgi:hypothetical protein
MVQKPASKALRLPPHGSSLVNTGRCSTWKRSYKEAEAICNVLTIDSVGNACCNPRPPMLNIPWTANVDDLLGTSTVINARAPINESLADMSE